MSLLLLVGLAMAAEVTGKTCYNATIDIPISSQNGVFDKISTPQTNFDAATFSLNATRQGINGTQAALSGYATISGNYKISTQYCMPNGSSGTSGNRPVLQILTHGIGFDRTYWDLPFNNYNYSYVDSALAHGYHTLSYDRLGIGNSSHGEPKNEIQAFLEVTSLAHMTQMVRNGSFPSISRRPRKIFHIGHSFGSGQTYALTAMYPNLSDAIVLTGFSTNSTFMPYFFAGANFQQAQLHRSQENTNQTSSYYPPGYLTSSNSNANQYLFFYPPYFDSNILALAEQNKKPVSVGELLTIGSVPMQSPFRGPVEIVTGSNDLPFCGGDCLNTGGIAASIPAQGQMSFPSASVFEAFIQPNTGHGINLHYNATGAYNRIADFLRSNGVGA